MWNFHDVEIKKSSSCLGNTTTNTIKNINRAGSASPARRTGRGSFINHDVTNGYLIYCSVSLLLPLFHKWNRNGGIQPVQFLLEFFPPLFLFLSPFLYFFFLLLPFGIFYTKELLLYMFAFCLAVCIPGWRDWSLGYPISLGDYHHHDQCFVSRKVHKYIYIDMILSFFCGTRLNLTWYVSILL